MNYAAVAETEPSARSRSRRRNAFRVVIAGWVVLVVCIPPVSLPTRLVAGTLPIPSRGQFSAATSHALFLATFILCFVLVFCWSGLSERDEFTLLGAERFLVGCAAAVIPFVVAVLMWVLQLDSWSGRVGMLPVEMELATALGLAAIAATPGVLNVSRLLLTADAVTSRRGTGSGAEPDTPSAMICD